MTAGARLSETSLMRHAASRSLDRVRGCALNYTNEFTDAGSSANPRVQALAWRPEGRALSRSLTRASGGFPWGIRAT